MPSYDYALKVFVSYKERQGRLSTFFRIVLAIPWIIWGVIWYIGFSIVVVLAWFVLLFTAKWPAELFGFAVKYLRFQARVDAWLYYMTDKFPPFGGTPRPEDIVTFEVDLKERYSRPKSVFRMVLFIPLLALGGGVNIFMQIFAFLAWWGILFTGRLPRWCYQPLADGFAWSQRFRAYEFLVVEQFPRLMGSVPPPGVSEAYSEPAPPPVEPGPPTQPSAPAPPLN